MAALKVPVEVLHRNDASSATTPLLVFNNVLGGLLTDIDPTGQLQFIIYDVSTETNQGSPVQVYPSSGRATVNLTTDRVSKGRYAASFSVPSAEAFGRHEIRWFPTQKAGAPEYTYRKVFDVVPDLSGISGAHYCSLSDMRDEGVSSTDVSDVRLAKVINRASRFIDRVTGRFFEPRYQQLLVDGSGGRAIDLNEPIIGIEEVHLYVSNYSPDGYLLDNTLFTVYNRHLSQGLTQPDDRECPRIEYLHYNDLMGAYSRYAPTPYHMYNTFSIGTQNVKVLGLFGYTEADGSPWGRTPEQLEHVCKLLVIREMPKLTDYDQREDRKWRWRVTSDRTIDQSISYDSEHMRGSFTGDPEIDLILASYVRPPSFAAV